MLLLQTLLAKSRADLSEETIEALETLVRDEGQGAGGDGVCNTPSWLNTLRDAYPFTNAE